MKKPSLDEWLAEAKNDKDAAKVGMYLTHNGVVREVPRAVVREGAEHDHKVIKMDFSYDGNLVQKYVEETKKQPGIYYVRVWINEGQLDVGEDLMYILIGGDIRPHVMTSMNFLIDHIKGECVIEKELTEVF